LQHCGSSKLRIIAAITTVLLCAAGCSKKSEPTKEISSKPGEKGTATIVGVVHLDGAMPQAQTLDTSQDPNCAKGLTTESIVGDPGRLQNVYIYVKSGVEGTYTPPAAAAVLDQRGCQYLPHMMGIMVGQKLQILNSDDTMHNVHPTANVNESWNLSQAGGSRPAETAFQRPELMIPVRCNVHPWMKMYLNVSSHPFFSVSRRDGTFEVGYLPPGTYTIAALHEKLGEKTQQITINKRGEKVRLDFTFNAGDSK
jgi:plastocyanin